MDTKTIAGLVMKVMRDELPDLKAEYGLKIASTFCKALVLEREAGETTPECLELLNTAIDAIG